MTGAVKQFPVKLPPDDWRPPIYKQGGGPDWTLDHIAELKRLRRAGYGIAYIARRLNRSAQAVRLKLHRLGIVMEEHRSTGTRAADRRRPAS